MFVQKPKNLFPKNDEESHDFFHLELDTKSFIDCI